jgi:beta-lactamase class A
MRRPAAFGLLALVFLVGVFAGFIMRERFDLRRNSLVHYSRFSEYGLKHITPLLDCEMSRDYLKDSELRPFEDKVEDFLKNVESKKWGDDITVYFRDLKNGPWFNIGKTKEFYPASLLKVPEMIAVLKEADSNPAILKKKIDYKNPELKSAQNTDVADKLVFGKSYTVEDLLKRMIVYSDNVSSILLEDATNPVDLKKTYDDLGIPDPYYLNDQSGYMISAELYSSFFRVLFNASYLSKEMSEKALQYLIDTDYKKGLVAGVPPNIEVAHKFGLRKINGVKQLHDCGIIYYPGHPYLLCVMTSGPVPEYLDNTIADISRFVYVEFSRSPHG